MNQKSRKALISIPIAVAAGLLIALAGSQGGSAIGGLPVFALAVAAAFVIQWLVFVPSYKAQTEKFYDLTGALTYIAITVFLVLASPGWMRADCCWQAWWCFGQSGWAVTCSGG